MTPRPPLFPARPVDHVFDIQPLAPLYACLARLAQRRQLSHLAEHALLVHVVPSDGTVMRLLDLFAVSLHVGGLTRANVVELLNFFKEVP